jgi:hypothetical protein
MTGFIIVSLNIVYESMGGKARHLSFDKKRLTRNAIKNDIPGQPESIFYGVTEALSKAAKVRRQLRLLLQVHPAQMDCLPGPLEAQVREPYESFRTGFCQGPPNISCRKVLW